MVLIMAVIAYAFWREGPLTAFAMCANVLVAGLLAFNFWEPVAEALDSGFSGSFLDGRDRLVGFRPGGVALYACVRPRVTGTACGERRAADRRRRADLRAGARRG